MIGRMHWLHALMVLTVTASLAGCATTGRAAAPAKLDASPVVAFVNNDVITLDELTEGIAVYRASHRQGVGGPTDEQLRHQELNRLIDKRLLLQEADREKIVVDDAEMNEEFLDRIKRYNVKTVEEFENLIRAQGVTLDSIKKPLRDGLKTARLIRRKVTLRVSVTEDDVTEYLARNRDKLEIGLAYRAREIVVVPDTDSQANWETARFRAEKVHAALRRGADFANLARQCSQDVSAQDGGDLGPLKRGEGPADIEAQILRLAPGEVSRPHRSNRGYHIFRLEDRQTLSDESVQRLRRHLRDFLFRTKYEARLEAWLGEIKQRAVIDVRGIQADVSGAPATEPTAAAAEASPYLESIRARIRAFWGYPCVENPTTRRCEYVTSQVVVEVRVHADGRLASIAVEKSSGVAVHDDYAVEAVRLASPFGAVPNNLRATGVPVRIELRFNYVVDRDIMTTLR